MSSKGSLVVVSGFSGVGKGTVMNSLIQRHKNYALSISATTRQPREGETDGKEYFFRTEKEFTDMISAGDLIEYACYCDNYYGTPRKFVEQQLDDGKDVVLEIEIQGARKIKKQYPNAVLIFVMPPSVEELKDRLSKRGTETDRVIRERIRRAAREADGIEDYDYIVINDEVEACADQMHQLIQSTKLRTSLNKEFIAEIRKQIKGAAK